MTEITLSQNLLALIDDIDSSRVLNFKWSAAKHLNTYYALSKIDGKNIYLHQFIMGKFIYKIDHIDGNGLNNTRSNLRWASHSQNLANRPGWSGASSQYKGVSWSKDRNKWVAQIMVDGKQKHLGRFESEFEAAQKYNDAATLYFGEFAWVNEL